MESSSAYVYESESLVVGEGDTTIRRICRPDEASSLSYDDVIGVAVHNVSSKRVTDRSKRTGADGR